MRKMKDSGIEWIGEIPESWEIVPLSKLSKRMNNGYVGPTRGLFVDDGVRYLQSLHIKNGEIFFEKSPYYVTEDWAKEHSTGTVHTNDVLIVQTGDIGQIAYVSNEFDGCNCHALIIVTPQEQICQGEYLSFLLQGHYAHHQLQMRKTGALHPHLNCGDIKDIKLPIPPLEIQTKLVSYMKDKTWEIDSIIAAKEKTNELLKERRQSIIYEVVTKGLDPTVPMKDSGVEWIGEIPTHWNTMRLRSKFSFGKGLPITKADLRDSGVSVVSYGQIHSKHNIGTTIKTELIRYVDNVYLDTNASSLVNNGDFIFADTSEDLSGCGNCVYVDTNYPLFAGYHTMILRPIENTSSKYYSYLFATDAWRSQIRAQASGVKLFSITQKMLRDALLIEPSEEEKASIVLFLDDMCSTTNTIIASNEATIEKLKEYRQSVIYEAVTGKVEI